MEEQEALESLEALDNGTNTIAPYMQDYLNRVCVHGSLLETLEKNYADAEKAKHTNEARTIQLFLDGVIKNKQVRVHTIRDLTDHQKEFLENQGFTVKRSAESDGEFWQISY